MGHRGPAPEGQAGQAVQRTLAQPPQSQREEVLVDSRGGPRHLQGPLPARKPLGRDRQAAPWEVSRGLGALLLSWVGGRMGVTAESCTCPIFQIDPDQTQGGTNPDSNRKPVHQAL